MQALGFDCTSPASSEDKLEFYSSTFNETLPQYQTIIPGQNLSDEDTYKAIARDKASLSCQFVGKEISTGRIVFSNTASVTITIKP